jgi:HlyD family secretion protein
MKKSVIIIGGICVAAVLYWRFAAVDAALTVKAVAAAQGEVSSTVSNTRAGTIKACRRSKLSMPSGGVVDKLLVKEGDTVVAGQVMLELWNLDRKADLAQSQAALTAAQADVNQVCLQSDRSGREANRQRSLAQKKLISDDALDASITNASAQVRGCEASKAQMQVANARLDMQKALLERTQLKAPFDGVVAEINGDLGEYVTPSPPGVATPPAVDLIDYSCLYVTAPIDEVDAGSLRANMPVNVTLDAFKDRNFVGVITRVAPYVVDIEKQARTVDVDVKLQQVPKDVALLVGYSADVTVVLDRREKTLRIPTEALLTDNQVWIVNSDKKLEKRQLKIGIGNWTYTEIVDGLKAGDLVVRTPDQAGLAEGINVIVQQD